MDNTRRAEMSITVIEELLRIGFQKRQRLIRMWTMTSANWLRRLRTRRRLRLLDACRLADIGVSEIQRASECAKWFWQK